MNIQQLESLEQKIAELLSTLENLREENQQLTHTNRLLKEAYALMADKNNQAKEKVKTLISKFELQDEVDVRA